MRAPTTLAAPMIEALAETGESAAVARDRPRKAVVTPSILRASSPRASGDSFAALQIAHQFV